MVRDYFNWKLGFVSNTDAPLHGGPASQPGSNSPAKPSLTRFSSLEESQYFRAFSAALRATTADKSVMAALYEMRSARLTDSSPTDQALAWQKYGMQFASKLRRNMKAALPRTIAAQARGKFLAAAEEATEFYLASQLSHESRLAAAEPGTSSATPTVHQHSHEPELDFAGAARAIARRVMEKMRNNNSTPGFTPYAPSSQPQRPAKEDLIETAANLDLL